jgi:hypothetical protein
VDANRAVPSSGHEFKGATRSIKVALLKADVAEADLTFVPLADVIGDWLQVHGANNTSEVRCTVPAARKGEKVCMRIDNSCPAVFGRSQADAEARGRDLPRDRSYKNYTQRAEQAVAPLMALTPEEMKAREAAIKAGESAREQLTAEQLAAREAARLVREAAQREADKQAKRVQDQVDPLVAVFGDQSGLVRRYREILEATPDLVQTPAEALAPILRQESDPQFITALAMQHAGKTLDGQLRALVQSELSVNDLELEGNRIRPVIEILTVAHGRRLTSEQIKKCPELLGLEPGDKADRPFGHAFTAALNRMERLRKLTANSRAVGLGEAAACRYEDMVLVAFLVRGTLKPAVDDAHDWLATIAKLERE